MELFGAEAAEKHVEKTNKQQTRSDCKVAVGEHAMDAMFSDVLSKPSSRHLCLLQAQSKLFLICSQYATDDKIFGKQPVGNLFETCGLFRKNLLVLRERR